MSGGSGAADVLIFVEDPGAAAYVAGLPAALAAGGITARLVAAGTAAAYLDARGEPFEALPAGADAARLLDEARPRLLLVGTSENPATLGLALVDEARRRGVESVGAVDAVSNADHRFRGTSRDDPLAHAPDRLLVPDAWTRDAFAALGLAADRIEVCGHPQYDRVRARAAGLEREGRAAVRARLLPRAPAGRPLAVFVAEISTGLNPEQYRRSAAYTLHGRGGADGRTEIVLEELLDAAAELDPRPYLVLRLHPKNTREELAPYLDGFDAVSAGGDPLELVYAADLVVGMTSMLLLEAALLGRPTLSIVPREEERGWLPSIRAGATPCAATRGELRRVLAARLAPGAAAAAEDGGIGEPAFVAFGSVERIRRFVAARLAARDERAGTAAGTRTGAGAW